MHTSAAVFNTVIVRNRDRKSQLKFIINITSALTFPYAQSAYPPCVYVGSLQLFFHIPKTCLLDELV